MSAAPESEFPTIMDLRDRMSELVELGLGEFPVQVLVVPDTTIQAISKTAEPANYRAGKAALMIEMVPDDDNGRIPVTIMTTDRWTGKQMQTTTEQ